MLLTNAHIISMNGANYEKGYLRWENEKISEIGPMEQCAQNDSSKIDLKEKYLLPGFVDAHSHLGLIADGIGLEGEDVNEHSDPCTPHLRTIDAINPFDRGFEEARMAGVTTAVISPGSTNPLAGEICCLKTAGTWVDRMVVKAPLAIKFSFGENPKMCYLEKSQAPVSRMAIAGIIREQLQKARHYSDSKVSAAKAGEEPPEPDLKCEALIPLLERKIKAHFHAHRAHDILTAVRIAQEFNLDFTLIHCTEGHMISDILAELGAAAVCGPIIGSRSKPELSNLSLSNCAKLRQAGVKVAISSDHPEVPVNFLQMSAAVAVSNGMTTDDALAAITVCAAQAAGIEERTGSLTPGLDADLLVFAQHPFESHHGPEQVWINGMQVK